MAAEKWMELYELQHEQGWTDETLLGMVLTFIINNGDQRDLMDELRMRADDTNDPIDDDDEDEELDEDDEEV